MAAANEDRTGRRAGAARRERGADRGATPSAGVAPTAGAALTAADLDVARHGSGPPVVLVHGSVVGAERTWQHQLPLAERWTLVLANRPGFAASPALERGDFEAEAPLFAELLGDGAHLVGHSYGAVIALYAAALRPQAVLLADGLRAGLHARGSRQPAMSTRRSRPASCCTRAPTASSRSTSCARFAAASARRTRRRRS